LFGTERSIVRAIYKDLLAGLTVALVALPLAIGFGVASGAGAASGIATAIVAGFIAAVLGGSRFQVSGPTGAMTVVLIPLAASHGLSSVLLVGFASGVLLILLGLFRLGTHVHRLPTALIEGFTAGIAVIIALQQVPVGLGLEPTKGEGILQSAYTACSQWLAHPNWAPMLVTAAVAAGLISAGHRWHRLPLSLIAVAVVTLANSAGGLGLATVGQLPPFGHLSLSWFGAMSSWQDLLVPAISVTILGALESLLSAKIADRMRPEVPMHNSNRELIGQGFANLAVPFFGGIPATAALARTAVNVRAGANSRLAAAFHAVVLAVFVLALAPMVEQIPLAGLAGVLIGTASHMIKPSELKHTLRQSRLDAVVLISTVAVTILANLTAAVAVGLVLFIGLRRTSLSKSAVPIDDEETLGD
jgi:sulfate permease, SulP family